MDDMCTDNRFELIERFKKKLIESTNIETSPEEMKAIDNLLFRFWQMGWLDIIDRMLLVKESAKTLMHSVGNSVSAKAFRNAGRFIQNAIDGEAPEFEKIPSAQPEQGDEAIFWKKRAREYEDIIADFVAEQAKGIKFDSITITEEGITFKKSQPEIIRCKDCKHAKITADGKYMKYCSQWDVDDALYLDSGFFCGHAERRTDEHSG